MRAGVKYYELSSVCTSITDGSHFSPKEDPEGLIPMLSVKDMTADGFDYSSCKYICESDYQVLVANGCRPSIGDVLVAKDGSYLKTAFVQKTEKDQAILSSIAILTPKTDVIIPEYLALFFKAPNTKATVEKHYLTGTAIKRVILKGFKVIKAPVPPLAEQERIVAELDLLQGIIDKQKAQLKELDTLAQSIFYDMFGDPVENKKGWVLRKLEEVCNSITDGDHMPPPKAERGIPFITISNIDKVSRTIDFQNTFFVPREYYDKIKYDRIAEKGDLLYTVTGSYGIPVIVKDSKPFCFQRHIALLKPDATIIRTEYLCYWALSASVKQIADDCATGIAQKTIGLNSIRKFPITLPPMDIQNIFATKIEAIERQKVAINASIAETQKLFDYTMDKYFG